MQSAYLEGLCIPMYVSLEVAVALLDEEDEHKGEDTEEPSFICVSKPTVFKIPKYIHKEQDKIQ